MLENAENVMSPALIDTRIKQTLTYNKYAFGSDWFPQNKATRSPAWESRLCHLTW